MDLNVVLKDVERFLVIPIHKNEMPALILNLIPDCSPRPALDVFVPPQDTDLSLGAATES